MIWIWLATVLVSSIVWRGFRSLNIQLEFLRKDAEDYKQKWQKASSDLASVRVKHGQAWESFVPLMKQFDDELGDKNSAVFLGQPIDLIYFNEKEIVFVEVKTGNSKLSGRQRNVKKLVKEKKIRWVEVNDAVEKTDD